MSALNRPNYGISQHDVAYNRLGDNNLRREFHDCFNIILSSCCNDNTRSSRYYSKLNDDNTSAYYVHQAEIEEKLDSFIQSPVDDDKFLIGFTGIGKTTLIKNYFKIIDYNPFVSDGDLIAYLSVHSDDMTDEDDVIKIFSKYLESIVNYLNSYCKYNFSSVESLKGLYNFVVKYKDRLINSGDIFNDSQSTEIDKLKLFLKERPVEFYSVLIKFLLDKINVHNCIIKKVVLIFDDIESQRKNVHIPFISKALNISSCMRTLDNRTYVIKTLISLRAYTFRYHQSRQIEAKRQYDDSDVILKDTIPSMKDIFNKRFDVYYDNEDVKKVIPNIDRWKESVKVLESVVNNIADFGDIVSSIAHYDIAHSLKMFLRILTNHRWFAPNENYYQGAYELSADHYLSLKERTLKALMYGENDVFVDNEYNILPNILQIHEEENPGEELLSLYVLEYMNYLQRKNVTTLYGHSSIKGKDLLKQLCVILGNIDELENKMSNVIRTLYEQEYLLHSVFEPEFIDTNIEYKFSREYDPEYGLYLSMRGQKLLEMLSNDSLLFEVYRDDIDTEISNNNIASANLSQKERIIYLINYCKELFKIEKGYIMNANKPAYFRAFEKKFIITRLVTGVKNTINYYFKKEGSDTDMVKGALQELRDMIVSYKSDIIESNEKISIDVSLFNDME